MNLGQLLAGVRLKSDIPGVAVRGLDYDSRRIEPGFVFFAFPGSRADGRQFASQAVQRGAAAVVSELPSPGDIGVPWIEVEHGRRALALAAKHFYNAPDERL